MLPVQIRANLSCRKAASPKGTLQPIFLEHDSLSFEHLNRTIGESEVQHVIQRYMDNLTEDEDFGEPLSNVELGRPTLTTLKAQDTDDDLEVVQNTDSEDLSQDEDEDEESESDRDKLETSSTPHGGSAEKEIEGDFEYG
jgi:hypothetical protein